MLRKLISQKMGSKKHMFLVTRIFTTVEVFTFLHNILVRSTRDDMFGTTYIGIGDGVGWGGDDT